MLLYQIAALTAIVCGAAAWFAFRRQSKRVATAVAIVVAVVMFGFVAAFQPDQHPVTAVDLADEPEMSFAFFDSHRPEEVPADQYVGSRSCKSCHADQHRSWHASYHRTMTQLATDGAIVPEMSSSTIDVAGHAYHFSKRNDVLWAEFDQPGPLGDLSRIERPLVITTGSHHMQVFWYPTADSRVLGQFPLIYLIGDRKWVPRDDAFLVPPHMPSPPETGRWNQTCANCHTTHPRSRPDLRGGWDTRVAEFGIACEACHGPGQGHVAHHRGADDAGNGAAASGQIDRIVNPARLSHDRGSQICARCHSLNTALSDRDHQETQHAGFRYRPGDDLAATRIVVQDNQVSRQRLNFFTDDEVEDIISNTFWPDGMARVSGREYSGLSQSACYTRGELSCMSCHQMHKAESDSRSLGEWADDQLGPGIRDAAACLHCHDADRYGERHTHHGPTSSGSNCYSCHMPYTSFGILKAIRSHRITVPDIALDRQAGRPNACNLCHLDQTLAWSASYLEKWSGASPPSLNDLERTVASAVLWSLTGDAGQRALAACAMGRPEALEAAGSDWQAPFLANLLEDPYAGVRYVAARSLHQLPGFEQLKYDYIGTKASRAAARDAAMKQWTIGESSKSELLLLPDGRIDQQRFDALVSQRDDRDVFLAE